MALSDTQQAGMLQLGSQAASGFFGWLGARKQHKRNLELAQFQAAANERYLDKQLEYNAPKNQMQRFEDADLNRHLIYGQGSPGNQNAPLTYPEVRPADWQQINPQAIQLGNQTALANAQIQATNAKTTKDTVQAGLARIQALVMEKNPLLNEAGFKATIDSLVSTAEIKASQSTMQSAQNSAALTQWYGGRPSPGDQGLNQIERKMFAELDLLEQRFKLGTTDQQIRAQILNGKEFQNAILEVQKRWLTEASVTPQHIYQFIQMLLMKLL